MHDGTLSASASGDFLWSKATLLAPEGAFADPTFFV